MRRFAACLIMPCWRADMQGHARFVHDSVIVTIGRAFSLSGLSLEDVVRNVVGLPAMGTF